MKITTIGIDLAKTVFAIHGVNEHGRVVLKKLLKRDQMAAFFANLPACLIGMEACGSGHYWARKLQGMGHTVRLIAPQFVKPYVKTNKNDAADSGHVDEEALHGVAGAFYRNRRGVDRGWRSGLSRMLRIGDAVAKVDRRGESTVMVRLSNAGAVTPFR